MFANFIYLLVALILYTTCQDPLPGDQMPANAVLFFAVFLAMFVLICRISFNRLEQKTTETNGISQDLQLDRILSRLSILAIVFFTVDLYFFRLNLLFVEIKFFQWFPTFLALIFLGVFLLHLVIIWVFAWNYQCRFFYSPVSRKNFVLSNLSFSLPALLPWFMLSIFADILNILPIEGPKRFLATPQGEITYVIAFLFAMATFGPVLIQKLWGCSSLEFSPVRARIEALLDKAGMKYADILKWELFGGSMITAGVMGLVGRFRYILVTPALINVLRPDEIDAVVAHEIGHIQKRHIHFYLFFFAGYIACVYTLFDPLILLMTLSRPLFEVSTLVGLDQETVIALFFSLILISLFLLYFRYIFGFFMRNFERQADLHVYTLMADAGSLISTFFKLARFNRQSSDKPNWHHFSIAERIRFLQGCEKDPSLITKHHTKIKKMISVYALAMVVVVATGYSLNFGQGKKMFNQWFADMVLAREMKINPENSELFTLIGDYYFGLGQFEKTITAYENVLTIDPDNVHALNNLAWLFATCEDRQFQDHAKALELAGRAIRIERLPYILDTYAEAAYLNQHYEDALEASLEALSKAEDRLDYYQKQVKRFRDAMP